MLIISINNLYALKSFSNNILEKKYYTTYFGFASHYY